MTVSEGGPSLTLPITPVEQIKEFGNSIVKWIIGNKNKPRTLLSSLSIAPKTLDTVAISLRGSLDLSIMVLLVRISNPGRRLLSPPVPFPGVMYLRD